MFTLKIERDLELALVEPSFAKSYYYIVGKQRDYLSKWLTWPPHANSEEFFLSFIQKSLHDYADGKSLTCAIVWCEKVVGNISFNTISYELKKVEIGYWLRSDYQGKGIVTKSVSGLISFAFNVLKMEKIQISAAVDNDSSRKICERLGFRLEGIISHSENLNDHIVDHAIYGLNREKWLET